MACALLDCSQFQLLRQSGFEDLSGQEMNVLLERMARLKDESLNFLIPECFRYSRSTPRLLKRLVRQKASDSCIEVLWSLIQSQSARHGGLLDHYCCCAPWSMLKRLISEPEIPASDAESMLGVPEGLARIGGSVPRKFYALYVVMFWEAPESAIKHFFDRVPTDVQLDYDFVRKFLSLRKYSSELCKAILGSVEPVEQRWLDKIEEYRPDLAKELGCCKKGALY